MANFFWKAIGSFKTTGTLVPSSKYLVKNCLKHVKFVKAKNIMEFGPGEGCITDEIAIRMHDKTNLYSIELNPIFYNFCSNKYSDHNNVHILNASALDFDTELAKLSVHELDYIVSSLPLSFLKNSEIDILLEKISKHLNKDGLYIQYQYSLSNLAQLKKYFDVVDISLTIRNFPPAFVYKCYNKS